MIASMQVLHFRNYENSRLDFAAGLNCIAGTNGQGKTNLLEAVYYLSLLRSFRTSNPNELRQWKASSFAIHGWLPGTDGPETKLSVVVGAERRLTLNGTPVYRASAFINQFVCVTFIPQDLCLVQGTPVQRRRFLDISASQIFPGYLWHLQAYSEALHSRNIMLKDVGKYTRQTITAYDALLAREGAAIEVERRRYAARLNEILAALSPELLGDGRVLSVKYMSRLGNLLQENTASQEEIERIYRELLERNFERDLMRGMTETGPHRSDFSCLLGGVMMQNFASQGECRLGSLALKLACLKILQAELGEPGVTLLVDDVIGELDADRRTKFFQAISGAGQTLFACTELPEGLPAPERVFHISNGTIQ